MPERWKRPAELRTVASEQKVSVYLYLAFNGGESMDQQEQQIVVWRHYEDVAMHFNGLLMHLRSQALGAVSVIITGAGLFVGHTQAATQTGGSGSLVSWPIAAAISALLLVAWVTLWVMDVCYYSKLLRGAINALVGIEKESDGRLRLSTEIENMFGASVARQSLNWPIKFFYVPISIALSLFTIVSICLAAHA